MQGLGFRHSGVRVQGLGIQDLGFRVQGLGIQGLGFRAYLLGLWGSGFGYPGNGFFYLNMGNSNERTYRYMITIRA